MNGVDAYVLGIYVQFQSSPAHYLFQNSSLSLGMVKALLKHKANMNIKNNVRLRRCWLPGMVLSPLLL